MADSVTAEQGESDDDRIVAQMKSEQLAPDAAPQTKPDVKAPTQPDVGTTADDSGDDDIALQMKQEQDQEKQIQGQLLEYRARNDKADPQKRADVLTYAAATGLAPDLVERNLDSVREQVKASKVDWQRVAKRQPGLVRMIQQNPALLPVVKDDAANLEGIEGLLAATFHAAWDGINEQRTTYRQFVEATGAVGAGEGNKRAIRDLEQQYSNKDYGTEGRPWRTGMVAIARMAPYMLMDMAARAGGGALGVALGAPEAGAATSETGPGAAVGAAAGGVGGAALGQFVGSGLFNYYEALGPNYERLASMRDAAGQPLDPSLVQAFAQSSAIATGGLMAGFFGKIGGSITKPLLARFMTDSVEKALTDASVTSLMKRGAQSYGKHWLTGAALMGAQSGMNQAAVNLAQDASGQPFDPESPSRGSVVDATAQGFVGGLKDMWLLSAIGPGIEGIGGGLRHVKDLGRSRESAEGAARYQGISENTAASKLLARSPELYERALAEMKRPADAVKNVYVPADKWTEYWQDKKLDPAQMASTVMGDEGQAYAEAVATKGDIAIPVEKYFAKLGKTEHVEGLAQDAKVSPEHLTPRQFAEEQKAMQARLELAAKARAPELEVGKAEVRNFIRDQALKAGIDRPQAEANAKLVSDYAGAMAVRLNVSVQEASVVGALGRLKIVGPKGERVASAVRERFTQFLRPSSERFLEQRLATMSPEARAQETFIDSKTGLREREVFDQQPVPEGKQVAVITSPDVKGINDHPTAGGHDTANDMLRAIGKGVSEDHPEAARGGTNFVLHVKDQAELDKVLESARKSAGNENLNITGALGENADKAFSALDEQTQAARAAGTVPERGGLNPKLDVAGLKFGDERAAGTVPDELLHEIGGLTDRQYAERVYVDKVKIGGKDVATGLLTRKAWEALPRKAHAAMMDMRGLKAANEKYGKETGNNMLFTFADLMAHLGGSSFDATHLSGDEYALQHDDPVQLKRFIDRFRAALKGAELEVEDPATGKVERISVDFRHGIGADLDTADRDLNTRKRREAEVPLAVGDQREADNGVRRRPGDVPQEVEGTPREERSQGVASAGVGTPDLGSVERRGHSAGGDIRAVLSDSIGADLPTEPAPIQDARGLGSVREGISADRIRSRATATSVEADSVVADRPDAGRTAADGSDEIGASGSGGARPQGATRPFQRPEVIAHIEGRPVVFNAGSPDKPRGTISMQLDERGKPREFNVRAFGGDKSTLLHETAHFLSWSFHDIAESDLATDQVRDDYKALLKWAGIGSVKDRLFKSKELEALQAKKDRTPGEERKLRSLSAGEERISHGFEQYLLEGKAPNAGLARVFSKFRGWLMGIYRGVSGIQRQYQQTYGEPLNLSDSTRDIFARLLGQDMALDQARTDTGEGVEPAIEGPRPPPLPTQGMTPAERDAYFAALQASRLTAEQEVLRRTAELHGKEVEDTREAATKEVTQEIDQMSVYRAQRYLQLGELADASGNQVAEIPDTLLDQDGRTYKIDRKAFVTKFGKDTASLMPRGIWAEKGKGVAADALAPLLGFTDGADMVDTFKAAEPRDVAIAREVQDRVDTAFAPALADMTNAAMSAVHNEHTAMATLLELRAAAKLVDPDTAQRVRTIDPKAMRDAASRLIDEKNIGDLDPDSYARAERRAAVRAASLWASNKPAAIEEKVSRLFNQMLYRAARDAADRTERVQAKLEATSDTIRANLGKADPSYRDVHDAILKAVGLGPEPQGTAGIDALLAKMNDDGHFPETAFDVDAISKLIDQPVDWDQLPVREARNIADAITYIRHIAQRTNTIVLNGKRVEKAAYLKSVADRAASVQKPQPAMPYSRTAEGFREKGRRLRRGGQALLEDIETLAEMLDGGTSGPAHDLLIDARIECRTKENELTHQVLKIIKEKWDKVPKEIQKLKNRIVDVAALLPVKSETLAPIFTRDTLWQLFLNFGSEGNRQRLRDGNGWTDENMQKALQLLTKPELDFLQGVTDSINSLYPELSAVYERRTGLKLGKVDAAPVTVGDATYPGGYHPLRYDSRMSQQGEKQEVAAVKDLFGSSYQRPTLPSSHTKERSEKVDAPVDMTWGTVPAHLSQVIRDISYGDWVQQTGSIFLAPEKDGQPSWKGITTKYLGEEREKEFVPWLRDVANARADSASDHQAGVLKWIGNGVRSTLARMAMGFNFPSLTRHMFDPYSAIADTDSVAPHRIATAYVKVMNPENWNRPEYAQSKELSNHEAQLNDNLRQELANIGPNQQGTISRILTSVAFYAHGLVHHFTSRVGFTAAYDQALANGATSEEAIRAGDDIVRRHFPSGDIAEKPPLLRTKYGAAAAVMYYGYASKMHNVRARSFDAMVRTYESPTATPMDKVTASAKFAGKWIALGAVSALGSYFAGRAWKKKDDTVKGAAEWIAEEIALDPADGLPFGLGSATKKLATGIIHKDWGHEFDIANSPELAMVEQYYNRIQRLIQSAQSSGRSSDMDKLWGAIELAATAMAGSEGQRVVGDINAQRKREFRPRGAFDQAAGAFYGAPTDKSSVNPLEQIQDVISKH